MASHERLVREMKEQLPGDRVSYRAHLVGRSHDHLTSMRHRSHGGRSGAFRTRSVLPRPRPPKSIRGRREFHADFGGRESGADHRRASSPGGGSHDRNQIRGLGRTAPFFEICAGYRGVGQNGIHSRCYGSAPDLAVKLSRAGQGLPDELSAVLPRSSLDMRGRGAPVRQGPRRETQSHIPSSRSRRSRRLSALGACHASRWDQAREPRGRHRRSGRCRASCLRRARNRRRLHCGTWNGRYRTSPSGSARQLVDHLDRIVDALDKVAVCGRRLDGDRDTLSGGFAREPGKALGAPRPGRLREVPRMCQPAT